jgi:hypothetical protein
MKERGALHTPLHAWVRWRFAAGVYLYLLLNLAFVIGTGFGASR